MNSENGESKMTQDTGFSTSDAVLWGAMNNMGRGGYGYGGGGGGAWGNGYGGGWGGHSVWASPGSNAVRINRNAEITKSENDCNRHLFGQAFNSVRDSFEDATRQTQFNRICDRGVDAEFRTSDRLSSIEREMAANARAAAECCCETQKELLKMETRNVERFCGLEAGQAAIEAKIDANQKFMELFAENQSLKTQVACGCTTGCTQRCHGHHGRG